PREERHLKLADPIEARCDGQSRIVGETMFEAGLVVFLTVNAGQGRRRAAQGTDEVQLQQHAVDDEAELGLARETEPALAFELHLVERSAASQEMRDQVLQAVGGIREIAAFLSHLEGAPDERAPAR